MINSLNSFLLAAFALSLVGCGDGNDSDNRPSEFIHRSSASTLVSQNDSTGSYFDLFLEGVSSDVAVIEKSVSPVVESTDTLHQHDLARAWESFGIGEEFKATLTGTDSESGVAVTRDLMVSHPEEISPNVFKYRAVPIAPSSTEGNDQEISTRAGLVRRASSQTSDSSLTISDPFGNLRLPNFVSTIVNTPAIELLQIENAVFLTNDKGSGAKQSYTAYRLVAPEGFSVLGDLVLPTKDGQFLFNTSITGLVIRAPKDQISGQPPILTPPIDLLRIWTDKGSGADRESSFWQPIAPPGYSCLGVLVSSSSTYTAPFVPNYRCVRDDLVIRNIELLQIYTDRSSGGKQDLAVYMMRPLIDALYISAGLRLAYSTYTLPIGNPGVALLPPAQLKEILQ